jgi:hypothetical protein
MSSQQQEHEEVCDILTVMRRQESSIYQEGRHVTSDELVGLWRRLLIEWMYYVVDYCQLQRQSVAAAAFFLDVCMSRGLIATREEHQLAAATALQLALKTFDSAVIKLDKLVKLGRGQFTEEDVVEMEVQICHSLNWHLHPPSTDCFLRQYERLLPTSVKESTKEVMGEVTKLVSELTVSEIKYNVYPPSVIAYSAMLLAMELLMEDDICVHQRHCFVLNMLNVAQLESKSILVLKAFEALKKTLDTSNKLQDLIQTLSLRNRQQAPNKKEQSLSREKSNISQQSPRHVMVRLGSSSS